MERVLTERELWYTAGIIDGEGSIGLYRHNAAMDDYGKPRRFCPYTPIISVSQCDVRLPLWLKDRFDGYFCTNGIPKLGRRLAYTWRIMGYKQAIPFLVLMAKRLLLKREQAELVLEYSLNKKNIRHASETEKTIENERRMRVMLRIKELNHRGALPAETERPGSQRWDMRQSVLHGIEHAEIIRNDNPSVIQ